MDGSSKSSQDETEQLPSPPVRHENPLEEGSPSTQTPAGASTPTKKEKARVRFNSNAALTGPPPIIPATHTLGAPLVHPDIPIPRPRPSVLRGNSTESVTPPSHHSHDDDADPEKASAAARAQRRAQQMADMVWRDSPTPESRNSVEFHSGTATSDGELLASHRGAIPLQNLGSHETGEGSQRKGSETDLEDEQGLQQEAFKLVRKHTARFGPSTEQIQHDNETQAQAPKAHEQPLLSEINDGSWDGLYAVPPPQEYRGSVLSQLLKLYKPPQQMGQQTNRSSVASFTGTSTPGSESGTATPNRKKWYNQNRSQETLANLIEASARLANPNEGEGSKTPNNGKKDKKQRPGHKRTVSSNRLSGYLQQQEARITIHIAETLARQNYIIKLCRALMLYGAPTHRLEEYLSMSARVLEIDGQFLYLPGCMIISFDDRSTHTTEVRIVRTAQGIDLGKLKDVHLIYKEVMHDVIGVEEGTLKLEALVKKKDKFNPWFRVVVFGLVSACAAPFSFKANLIDLPLIFCFGCLVGFLQLIVTPKSNLYSNVFEVSATVVVSFLARAFGSIRYGDGRLFCFSALAQGGITMLLPGYLVLCSSLELQSRAIVPGSIRIVYAVIYSLLLGFGITVGAALWGLFTKDPVSSTTCSNPLPGYWPFIFVPPFVVCMSIIYQAKWRQLPAMVTIAFTGYIVNYFSSLRFVDSPQISSTLGALTVGVLANLYSRIRHGVAAAILIPAVFTQVPGGLASTGGLLSGLTIANKITNSSEVVNGTTSVQFDSKNINTVVFDVAASMIQIAIGIAVGLFLSALLIYPLGKRRSGLFSM